MKVEPLPRRPISLTLRLTLSIAGVIILIFLGLGWTIERSLMRHFAQQDAEELEVVAHSIQHVISHTPTPLTPAQWQNRLSAAVQGHHGMFYRVSDASGQVLFQMEGPNLAQQQAQHPATDQVHADHLIEWAEGGEHYRGAVLSLPPSGTMSGPYGVVVATVMSFHEHFLGVYRRTIWAATSLAAVVAILATWLAVYRGHAPLRDMSQRIRGITANQLHVRLDPREVPVELEALTDSFNTMLERVEQDFRKLTNFSADIAHELRTPVTNLITQTQVLLTKPRDANAYREALYAGLEEYERMAKMIGDMLYLAQTDHHLIKPERSAVDLRKEIQDLFEYFEPWAEERSVSLRCEGPDLTVQGDRLMLRRAFSNLLSNAIRYTPDGQTVTVNLSAAEEHLSVRFSNPGPTIPEEHLPHLFDRFYRADPSRQRNGDGAGLGLAIVKAIVEAHGGHIYATSWEEITEFEVILPHPTS